MNDSGNSNFDFLERIIEIETDEGIRKLLRTIKWKTKQAERQVAINQKENYSLAIESADSACDYITRLYVRKKLPEEWEKINGKKNPPGKHEIWITEDYSKGWDGNDGDIALFVELFELKGEANYSKHGKKKDYDRPIIHKDKNSGPSISIDENRKVKLEKGIVNPNEYATYENAMHRLRNLFDYTSAVIMKCGYITEEQLPIFQSPKRQETVTEETLKSAVDSFAEYIKRGELNRSNGMDGPDPKPLNRRVIIAASVIVVAVLLGIAIFFGLHKQVSSESSLELEQDIDSHIIMKLSNANHQYEVGLENWKRLDYNRAERDITGAISDIIEEKSQAEIDVAKINNSLGCLYLDMGKYESSYDYLNNAYVTFRDEYGEEDPQTLAVLFSIAQYDYYIGDYDSALKMAQQILDNSDIAHDKTVSTLIKHFQASIYSSRGDYESALAVYQDVLKIYQDYLKDDKLINELANYTEDSALDESDREKYTNMILWIAKTYENIGETYSRLGKNDEAMDAVSIGLNMCLDNIYIGKKNISTASLYLQKAAIEEAIGNNDDAVDDADLAIRIERNLFDFQDVYPGLVEAYDLYGFLMEKEGNKDEASQYYDSALELALQSFGENHPNTAEAYYYCGQFASNEKQHSDAEAHLTKAIDIRKNILGENHPNTVKYYLTLSEVESALGKTEEAKACEKNAEKIKASITK